MHTAIVHRRGLVAALLVTVVSVFALHCARSYGTEFARSIEAKQVEEQRAEREKFVVQARALLPRASIASSPAPWSTDGGT